MGQTELSFSQNLLERTEEIKHNFFRTKKRTEKRELENAYLLCATFWLKLFINCLGFSFSNIQLIFFKVLQKKSSLSL